MRKLLRRPVVWQTLLLGVVLVTLWLVAPLFELADEDRWDLAAAVGVLGGLLIFVLWLRRHLIERHIRDKLKREDTQQATRAGQDALRDMTQLQRDFNRAFAELTRAVPGRGVFRSDGAAAMP